MSVREQRTHALWTDAHWFDLVAAGEKTAELRKHDRDFQVGDLLLLVREEYDRPPVAPQEEERERMFQTLAATISHVLPATVWPKGLQPEWSMISFHVELAAEMGERVLVVDYGMRRAYPF